MAYCVMSYNGFYECPFRRLTEKDWVRNVTEGVCVCVCMCVYGCIKGCFTTDNYLVNGRRNGRSMYVCVCVCVCVGNVSSVFDSDRCQKNPLHYFSKDCLNFSGSMFF